MAWDHALCRAVVAVFLRAVGGWLRARARRRGIRGGRWGAVAIVQRFGSALNLNVHIHALVLDGVYAPDRAGRVRFWCDRGAAPDLARLLAQIQRRVERLLARRGHPIDAVADEWPDAWRESAPVLAALAAASVQGVAATGRRAGQPVRRWGKTIDLPAARAPRAWHAQANGFDLDAGQRVPAKARERLERLCRYVLRPAVGQTRLQAMPDGTVVVELGRRWRDGTTHLVFEPLELLERLAVLVPRPRVNLLLYHGLLAPRAAWRRAVVPARATEVARAPGVDAGVARPPRPPNRTWAELMQRGFGFDVLACPRCGGRLRLAALIHAPAAIARILEHLQLPVDVPASVPARAPPAARDADLLTTMAD
jgi:hypothetical protein